MLAETVKNIDEKSRFNDPMNEELLKKKRENKKKLKMHTYNLGGVFDNLNIREIAYE